MRKIALAALLFVGWTAPAACAGYDDLNVGIQYSNDEAWASAIVWLNKAINAGDLLPDQMRAARYNRARAYVGTGKPAAAIEDFTAALALTPDDVRILTERAFANIAAGQGEQAVADLRKAHEKRPKNASIDLLAGLVNWSLDRPEDASTAFAAAFNESKSGFAWLWLKLADTRQKKETENFYGITYYWPGTLMELYRGSEKEGAVFNKVKEYGDSENCEAIFYVAEWRLARADIAGGKEMLQKAVSDCPKDNVEWQMAQLELKKLP